MLHIFHVPNKVRFFGATDGGNLSYLVGANVPLPSPDTVYNQAYSMAWPQVLAFSSACIGIASIIYIIRSFSR
jgi:hypothetical protein